MKLTGEPSDPDWPTPASAVGATFATDQSKVSVATSCSPSLACTMTQPEPLSVVAKLHDHVPSPLSVTSPSPLTLVMVNVSFPSASENAPEVPSVAPSLSLASSAAVSTAGAYELESQASPRSSPSASA